MVSSSFSSTTRAFTSDWQWQDWQGLPYLTCNLLADWQHGFLTQQFYPRIPEELVKVLQPEAPVYRVKQIHGNRVLTPTELNTATKHLSDGDGIITDDKQQAVWVASADCNPVLIGDIETGRVAAIHAGWRGTAQKIVPNAIARFLELGSIKDNLRIAMGPAISGEVYQVSKQVAAEVGASIISSEKASSTEEILLALQELPDSPLLEDSQPDRVRLDVRRVNSMQIRQLGLSSEQIAIAPFCTYQQPDYFFSYRRSKEKKVQWSGIVSIDAPPLSH